MRQADALRKVAIEAGLIPQSSADGDLDGGEMPELLWVRLPGNGRQMWEFAREIGSIIAALPAPEIFRYKDGLATVEWNEAKRRHEIAMMDPHDFRSWVEYFCTTYREVMASHGAVKVKQTMGVDDARSCLRAREFVSRQPQLLRINPVRLPIARSDGRIELLPVGYDPESCILTTPQKWEYDETMQVQPAAAILTDLLREFPFQDARSRSVAIAMFLAQFGYFLQPLSARRLGFFMNANSTGAGKTLLVELALTVPWLYATIESLPDQESKVRDRLDTAVREAKPYLVLDDLDTTFVRSGLLNSFMTSTTWGGRKFYAQEEFNEAKTPVIFFTGNNIEVTPDIARRTLSCELFDPQANVADRPIERPLDADWMRTPHVHQQVCSALWALIRHWRDNGRGRGGREVRGYERWSQIFSGIMLAAGLGDPCEPMQTEGIGNTEYQDMLALITRLAEGVSSAAEYKFMDIVQICRELNCFERVLDGKMVKHKEGDKEWSVFELTPRAESLFGRSILCKYGGKMFATKDGRRVVFDKRGKNRHRRYTIAIAKPQF